LCSKRMTEVSRINTFLSFDFSFFDISGKSS
jgi:hypothetical protein